MSEEKVEFNLEASLKGAIEKKLNDGTIEKMVEEKFEEGVNKALSSLFSSYGDVTKVIEEELKSVIVPYIEGYNYSEYVTKLDVILTSILKETTSEHKQLLENFQYLMIDKKLPKKLKVSELFDTWAKFVEKHVETDELEINYDDGEPTYYSVEIVGQVEYEEGRSWSSFQHATIFFSCEHDEKMNFHIPLSNWKEHEETWDLRLPGKTFDFNSLRNLSDFEMYLMQLEQNYTKIILDEDFMENDVEPENRPEISFE